MRKSVSAIAVAASLMMLAAPALAQEYPPTTSEGLTVSETTLRPGESFVASGEGADPGDTVTFRLSQSSASSLGGASRVVAAGPALASRLVASRPLAQGTSLGSTTADSEGAFRATLTIPLGTDPGLYTLTAADGGDTLGVVTIRVVAAADDDGAGGLPFTGSNVAPGLAVGASLILAGGLLLLALRRRRVA
jgi:membrane anchored protein